MRKFKHIVPNVRSTNFNSSSLLRKGSEIRSTNFNADPLLRKGSEIILCAVAVLTTLSISFSSKTITALGMNQGFVPLAEGVGVDQNEFSKYGLNSTNFHEDMDVDLKQLPILNDDRANIGFTMFLDPDSDLFDSSDTLVSFTHRKSGVKFTYTFSHLGDYDRENNVCKGTIQIPADSYFNDYDITVYTVSNGFNGGNLCYQERIEPVAGGTYGLTACAGSLDWLKGDGEKLLRQHNATDSTLETDGDVRAENYKRKTAAPKKTVIKDKEKKPDVTVQSEPVRKVSTMTKVIALFGVLVFIFVVVWNKVRS